MEIYWVRPSHHYYSSQAMEVSPVIIKGLLQLSLLLVHVAKVGVGLCQQGVLLDGQCAEVRGSERRSRGGLLISDKRCKA